MRLAVTSETPAGAVLATGFGYDPATHDDDLALAATGAPAGVANYWARCIDLPRSGDPNLFVFSASVALQRLAFRMSELKMHQLDALGVRDHGVHPDTPKNVSKSITVD